MALSWTIKDVENADDLINDPVEQGLTEAVVFMTMAVGINRITEKNVETFVDRAAKVEAQGPFYRGPAPDHAPGIPAAAIRRRIGLHTNASTKTQAAFNKQLNS
jgi:hypothetical protein